MEMGWVNSEMLRVLLLSFYVGVYETVFGGSFCVFPYLFSCFIHVKCFYCPVIGTLTLSQ